MASRLLKVLIALFLGSVTSLNGQLVITDGVSGGPYEQGMELFDKGHYGQAQLLFDQAVQESSGKISVEQKVGAAYYAALSSIKLFNADASQRVNSFQEKHPLSPLVNQLNLEYANFRFATKRYREALTYYDKVDAYRLSNDDKNEYLFKKAYSMLNTDDVEGSKEIFFELKDKESKYATSAKYYYAHLLYVDSNYTESLQNFLALQEDPSFGTLVPYYLAHIYYNLQNYDKLVEVGEALIEKATSSRAPEIAKLLADAFYQKRDYTNTIKYLELYSEKGGAMHSSEHFELGYSYYKTQNYYAAIGSFNKIAKGNEALKQNAYYHLGDCHIKTGNRQQAISAFKAASEIQASQSIREDAYFNYAKLAYELSDPYGGALDALTGFVKEFPVSKKVPEANKLLANLYITTKDYDKALLAIKSTGLASPEMKAAYQKIAFFRANEIYGSQSYKAAITKYDESLQYPINTTITALATYWQGEAYYRLQEYDRALEKYQTFRQLPGSVNLSEYELAIYNIGYTLYKKFDFQKAAQNFRDFARQANKKDKRLPDAYLRLADCYLLTGGYLVAADFYQSAITSGTSQVDYALFQRSECLGLASKRLEKIRELEKLVKEHPSSPYQEEAYYEIAATQLQLEQYNEALAGFQNFISNFGASKRVPKGHLMVGLIYSNTDKNQQALNTFQAIVRDYPGTDESIEAVGLARLIYARQNRINDYLDWVETLNFVSFSRSALDSTAFSSAFDLYSVGNCKDGISSLDSYLDRFPKGIFALKAHYYQADCANRLDNKGLALKSHQAILQYPDNEFTNEAREFIADNEYDKEEYQKAIDGYQKLEEAIKDKSRVGKYRYRIMKGSFILENYHQAISYANILLSGGSKDDAITISTKRILAISNYKLGNVDKAYSVFENLVAIGNGEVKAEALYHKSKILNLREDYEVSSKTVYQLVEELPSYKEWKMKGLLILANNLWKQKDIFQANYTLDFIVKSNFSPTINEQAQAMKDAIEAQQAEEAQALKEQMNAQADEIKLDAEEGLLLIDDDEFYLEEEIDEVVEPENQQE